MIEAWQQFYAAVDVRELDRRAIQDHGIPGYTLMQRAAAAAWQTARRAWGLPDRLVVFCGSGNNGGDGYEIACLAHADGVAVEVRELGGERRGDAATARAAWLAHGAVSDAIERPIPPPAPAPPGDVGYAESVWVVDALFGTGLSRAPSGEAAAAIACIRTARNAGARVLAVDVPSGHDADTGQALGPAVQADMTVTFIADKVGLHTAAGAAAAGSVHCAGLQVPPVIFEGVRPRARRLEPQQLRSFFRPRARDAHKNRHGHVLIIGGAPGMAGAALLAGRAALRSGAGLVSVATHPAHAAMCSMAQAELMVHGVDEAVALAPLLERATVVAIGPGLGQGDWSRCLFQAARDADRPLVMDADALNLLAQQPVPLRNAVLTPHPGEAARLLGREGGAAVEADRLAALEALEARYGCTALIKGLGTLVSAERSGDPPWLCTAGNPGMAVGGSGDVLTGVVAACMAQGMSAAQAARAAVLAHAHAGDLAAHHGERGMLPSDLVAHLRAAVNPRPERA
ncbi:MAG: NAD(P)H-hydrate dehydratase [Algiphilus sp.]|uniref:NAD(P)H-hydrate dehydratase n=1 Tax=Algiphilus sp. TaxID=1872431 RepID=UPI0032EE1624